MTANANPTGLQPKSKMELIITVHRNNNRLFFNGLINGLGGAVASYL